MEPLTLGNRLRWPTAQIAEALGLPYEVVTDDAGSLPEGGDMHDMAQESGAEPGDQ